MTILKGSVGLSEGLVHMLNIHMIKIQKMNNDFNVLGMSLQPM